MHTTLGQLLRSVREAADTTKVAAAAAAGVSRESVRRWEDDTVAPSLRDLHGYLRAIGAGADELETAERLWLDRHRTEAAVAS